MTEAMTLALSLLGLLMGKQHRWLAAGLTMGAAGSVRPMACFATIGLLVALIWQRKMRPALLVAAGSFATFAVGTAAGAAWKGNLLGNARIYRDDPRAYGGELFALPFSSLIRETFSGHRPIGFSIYIWCHVVLVLGAVVLLGRSARRNPSFVERSAWLWLVGNTLFILCIGSYWGYQHFPRFAILAQPALLFAWRAKLPASRWSWLAVAIIVTIFGVFGVRSSP
jgi:hypothetical protein